MHKRSCKAPGVGARMLRVAELSHSMLWEGDTPLEPNLMLSCKETGMGSMEAASGYLLGGPRRLSKFATAHDCSNQTWNNPEVSREEAVAGKEQASPLTRRQQHTHSGPLWRWTRSKALVPSPDRRQKQSTSPWIGGQCRLTYSDCYTSTPILLPGF
jgi:hypothetical protein